MVFVAIFSIAPLYGLQIAFKDFNLKKGITNSAWAGLKHFRSFLSSVDMEVIESAVIDGAGRFRRIWNIMLPSILPTIMILFILNIGSLLGGGLYGSNFQLSYSLGNRLNISKSEILDTYVLKLGIELSRFSYATAVSLISSVTSALLLLVANVASKKVTGEGYF